MKKIAVINGPNLNLIGTREPEIYGDQSLTDYIEDLGSAHACELISFQSNSEGELVDAIQSHGNSDGIILNAAAYTHTSVAIRDAIASIEADVVEVHISNIYAREEFRSKSVTAPVCKGLISGLGLKGYELALRFFL